MGQLINIVEEIRLRMKAGIDANAIESSHGDVYVGSKEGFLKMNDYPIIGIILPRLSDNPVCMANGVADEVSIDIGYAIPKLTHDYNILYSSSDSTGPLRNFEQIVNYLVTNRTTSAIDLQLAGTAYTAIKYSGRIQEADDLLFFSLTVNVNVGKYTRGAM
jgi:hypothetical protein